MMKHAGTQMIKSERLILRKIELSDADMMFRNWANDDEVTRYMRWQSHKDSDETRTIIQQWFDDYKNDYIYHWGICLEDGEMIGSIGVMIISEHDHKAEIGYCIGRKWWGKGYTSEAAEAVIDYMYVNTDIERIEAYHAVENTASGKVMLNAGMAYEGFARHKFKSRDGFKNSNMYGIVREMWDVKNEIAYYNSLPFEFNDFIDVPELSDGVISLICTEKNAAVPEKRLVPGYYFDICIDGEKIGGISLRIGYTENLYYGGQIGYDIDEAHRGNGYAVRACKLVLPVVKAHKMKKLLITTNYTNKASMRVCEKLGLQFIRIVRLPEWNDLYKEGQRQQNIYEWNLE